MCCISRLNTWNAAQQHMNAEHNCCCLVSLTLHENKQGVVVQLVYLNYVWTGFLCKHTQVYISDNKNQQFPWESRLDYSVCNESRTSVPRPEWKNQDVLEFRLMYSMLTGTLGFEPRDTPIHTRGYSGWATTTISNTRRGLGRGKSKCCKNDGDVRLLLSQCSQFPSTFSD